MNLLHRFGENFSEEYVDPVLGLYGNCIPAAIATLTGCRDEMAERLHSLRSEYAVGMYMHTYYAWRNTVSGLVAGRGLPPNRPGRWLLHTPEEPPSHGLAFSGPRAAVRPRQTRPLPR